MCEHWGTLTDEIVHQAAVPTSGNTKTCAPVYLARAVNRARYLPEFVQVCDLLRCP
ncbi:hypothetical protein [Burkholderia arboris]|uniref:hypothetical protein n=1 Tax=Burkholderia arboris TaxID=488730 RepID=UPI0030F11640